MSSRGAFLPGNGVPGLVSVIIPTYQRGSIIGETLDSLLAQSYGAFEAIVVDDGSTDETERVVARYTDPRIRYIRKAHSGLSETRNLGLENAAGEFIGFLDSDDLWVPWKLETQLAVFARHADVGMVWSDMSTFVTRGEVIDERHLRSYYRAYERYEISDLCDRAGTLRELSGAVPEQYAPCEYFVGSIFPAMFFGNLVHPPTAVVRRSRLQKSGPFEPEVTGRGGEDYHFYLRVTEQGPVAFLDAPTIHYRIHASQMSTAHSLRESRSNLRLVEHWRPRVSHLVPRSEIRTRLASAHAWVGTEEWAAGNPRDARRHLWQSVRRRPNTRTAVLLAATLLPNEKALRAIKHRIEHFSSPDRLVKLAMVSSGMAYLLYRLFIVLNRHGFGLTRVFT